MPSSPRRTLILPDEALEGSTLLRVEALSPVFREEEGRSIRQPVGAGDLPTLDLGAPGLPTPVGDIKATLSGIPEKHVEGRIHIGNTGPVDAMRWGFIRGGDDEENDLQFRQSPHVIGRRPDAIDRADTAAPGSYINRPKLLSLISGDVLLVYMRQDNPPDGAVAGLGNAPVKFSRLDHTTNRWSAPVDTEMDADEEMAELVDVDIVQFPDTGEIVAVLITQDVNHFSNVDDRRIYVYHSTDDGDTFVLTARLFAEGQKPGIDLTGDTTDFQGVACEIVAGGAIAAFVVTNGSIWSLVSHDRGKSWATTDQGAIGGAVGYGASVACAKMRNDVVLVFIKPSFPAGLRQYYAYLTVDGSTLGPEIDISGNADNPSTIQPTDVSVVMRPDGYPHLYACAHSDLVPEGAATFIDWLVGMASYNRDPDLSDDYDDLFLPSNFAAFHCIESTPLGALGSVPRETVFQGFVQLDTVLHRGQVLMAVVSLFESGTPENADFEENTLMVYSLNHWQPLQEQLTDARVPGTTQGVPATPARGRIYNRTWDCYALPTVYGYTLTSTGGSSAILTALAGGDPLAEGGYLRIITTAQTRYYTDLSIPSVFGNLNGAARCVVRVLADEGTGQNDIILRFHLDDGAVGHGIYARFRRTGGTTTVDVFDAFTGAQIGVTATFAPDLEWVEFICALYTESGSNGKVNAFAREYERADDPDWDSPYIEIADYLATTVDGSIVDTIRFGHETALTGESHWKTVQVHRTGANFRFATTEVSKIALAQRGDDFIDDEIRYTNPRSGDGHHPIDDGIDNSMRCSQGTAVPSQFMERAEIATWRGEALVEGNFDHQNGYDYGGANVLILPVQREWRSDTNQTGSGIEMVWDAGGGSGDRTIRPWGAALFGRNFHSFTIELNDADAWGAPSVSYSVGMPGQAVAPDRYSHLWATDLTGGWSFTRRRNFLTVNGPFSGSDLWRYHQFRSVRSGVKYYLFAQRASGPAVYRILDNTNDTLTLGVDMAADLVGNEPLAIFSDRCAFEFLHKHSLTDPPTDYRYMRLLIDRADHRDSDESFARLGRLIAGEVLDLGDPDYEWFWRQDVGGGTDLEDTPGGATYDKHRHAPRRVWTVDRNPLEARRQADAVLHSPSTNQPRTWQEFAEIARRLEMSARDVALIWEADRAEGLTGEALVQVAASYHDMACVRVTSHGSATHAHYLGQTMNLPGGDECVPQPIASIRGITFSEQL